MKKYLPIIASLLVVGGVAFVVISKKNSHTTEPKIEKKFMVKVFNKQKSCARQPKFLTELNVTPPITIDLSQQSYKGLAFLWGKNLSNVIHPKAWETYEHFSTYALDQQGNAYLAPMPFISIKPTTFNLQKNIYKLDSSTGKLSIFMQLDDVNPSANNPYGIISLVYDCNNNSLWVSAIDESDYKKEKGVIYNIDVQSKRILQKIEGVDALTLSLLTSDNGKYLLFGSARDNALYAYKINNDRVESMAIKLLDLPNANEHIRKIKIKGKNLLELQTIPFSYTLIAETSSLEERNYYKVEWNENSTKWLWK